MTVAVVGAGITGLALTHHLAERGVDCVTFEAREQPGGVIQSTEAGGLVAEIGPQRLRATPGIRDLAAAAGIEDRLVTAKDGAIYVYAGGRLREAPTSVEAFLRTDLLSWPAKLRLLAEPLTRSADPRESVAEVFTRKFGRAAYERFIGPLYGGLYGSDPAEMPAAFALSGLLERAEETGSLLSAFRQRVGRGEQAPPASVEGGLQELPRALAARYGDRVHLGEPVTDLAPAGQADEGRRVAGVPDGGRPRFAVETAADSYRVDDVVVTAPADAAADLLAGLVDGAEALRELTYNPLALVYLAADSDPGAGLGYQVGYGEALRTLGVSFNGRLFDRDGLCTVFLGGMHDPGVLEEGDDRLGRIAREEFETATGCSAEVVGIERRERWFPAYDHSWWGIEDLETPPGIHLATNYTARMGIPSRVREAEQVAERLAGSGG
jgi:oxygen-dependent protoporphyrinogen oxidase